MRFIVGGLFLVLLSNNANAKSLDEIMSCGGKILPQSAFTKTTSQGEKTEPDGFVSESFVTKLNNTKGKCFKITSSEFIFLIDRDQAIYKVYTDDYANPLVMIDFNKKKAPLNGFSGIVKGVGKYTYKDGRGIPKNIPYMIVGK